MCSLDGTGTCNNDVIFIFYSFQNQNVLDACYIPLK